MSQTTTIVIEDRFQEFELNQIQNHPTDYALQRHRLDGEQLGTNESPASPRLVAPQLPISKWRMTIIMATVACVTLFQSMLTGMLIVSLPTMAKDLNLAENLLLWPASASALACGCTLLLSGSIADVVGGRVVYLCGQFALVITTTACGVCQTGIQLILFRAAQGVAMSLCLPTSISLITQNVPIGSYRNAAFACLGAGQPVGFSIGLVLGGVFVDSIGWRYGYYIGAVMSLIISVVSIFAIPKDTEAQSRSSETILRRLRTEVDWIGCCVFSTSLGIFSYIFSILASGTSNFIKPAPLALFAIAVGLIPVFVFHVRTQERHGRKAIIPPALWKNRVFTTLCITVFVVWGVFEAMQYFLTLFYQSVQSLSALQTSLRFLPMVATGTMTNVLTGWLVKQVRADFLVLVTIAITAVAPLIMAIVDPSWSYWACAFIATLCAPICADTLFTVANLLITSVFPPETHGLAGGVFNTIACIGNSVGLAVGSVIASGVTMAKDNNQNSTAQTVMDGYRVTFWVCFGVDVLSFGVVWWGLRQIGKVGIKVD